MSATSSSTSELSILASVAGGIASVIPGGQPVAIGLGSAVAIADLVAHISSLYSQKVISASQMVTMISTSVSGFNLAVKDWEDAAPATPAPVA